MNVNSLHSNSSQNNNNNTDSTSNITKFQKKTADINAIVNTSFSLKNEDHDIINKENDLGKISLSTELKCLINKIYAENTISGQEILIQVLIQYAAKQTEKLTSILKKNGVDSCLITEGFFLLYSHTGMWLYEINNRFEGISCIKKSSFFLLPDEFTIERIKNLYGSEIFNPLELNLKNHLYSHILKAFMHAKSQPLMSWEEIINDNEFSGLINEILLTSKVIREVIYNPNYAILCEYNTANFIDNFNESDPLKVLPIGVILEDFEFIVRSYKFYNKFILPKEVRVKKYDLNGEVTIARDLYWFIPDYYEKLIEYIRQNKDKKNNISEWLLKILFKLFDIINKSNENLHLANKGILTYESWIKSTFNQPSAHKENNFNFRTRMKMQTNLLRYFLSAYEQMLSQFMIILPHGIKFNSGRDTFTLEIAKQYSNLQSPERLVVKNPLVKKYYDFSKKIVECFDIPFSCDFFVKNYGVDFNWFKRVMYFHFIENTCNDFRKFSCELLKRNTELKQSIEAASERERNQIEREYDLVKSHLLLPIFILNSLSIMEKQYKNIILIDDSIDITSQTLPENKFNSYLDEINSFFIEDEFFQELHLKIPEIQQLAPLSDSPQVELLVTTAIQPANIITTTQLIPSVEALSSVPSSLASATSSTPSSSSSSDISVDVHALNTPMVSSPIPSTTQSNPPVVVSSASNDNEVSFSRGIKVRNLIKELKELGFDLNRQTGSHAIFKLNNQQVVVPTSSDTLPRGTLNSIEDRVNEIVKNKKS